MAKIDSFVSQWRQALASDRQLNPETLDELEAHLREKIERHMQDGLPDAEACERAAADLGDSNAIATEFRKLDPLPWLPAKLVTAVGLALALGLALVLLARFRNGSGDVLLAINGKPVQSVDQVKNVLQSKPRSVALLVQRDGEKIFVPVNIG